MSLLFPLHLRKQNILAYVLYVSTVCIIIHAYVHLGAHLCPEFAGNLKKIEKKSGKTQKSCTKFGCLETENIKQT